MTCSRVLILHRGRILAADRTEDLANRLSLGGQVVAEIAAPESVVRETFQDVPEVERMDIQPIDGEYLRLTMVPRNGADVRERIFAEARERGWALRELTRSRQSLEDIFVHLTRGKVREE